MDDAHPVDLEFPRPIETIEPARLSSPLVFSSPHSGSIYPKPFLADSRLDALTLRRSEDAFVDELFLPCVRLGAPLLRALFPRAYLDVNREPFELDPQIFDGPLPDFANSRSLRVAVGLGTIPRVVGDAQPIYKRTLSVREGLKRIDCLYRPYHASLKSLVDRARARFGVAVLIDCHSMPSNASDVSGLDFVLGDRYGASAAPRILEVLEANLRSSGYRVRRNKPFAGGFITEHFGRRHRACTRSKLRSRGRFISMSGQSLRRPTGSRCAITCLSRPKRLPRSSAGISGPRPWRLNNTSSHHDSLTGGPHKKGGRHVATAAFSLGRKRPRRAYATTQCRTATISSVRRSLASLFCVLYPNLRGARIRGGAATCPQIAQYLPFLMKNQRLAGSWPRAVLSACVRASDS